MTHDRQLERLFLLLSLAVLAASGAGSYYLRDVLSSSLRGLKPSAPPEDYIRLLILYVPIWGWCAERMELFRVSTLARPLFDGVRALIWTQAWGTAALTMLLVVARMELNRSFLLMFLLFSSALLLVTLAMLRLWLRAYRGRSLILVVGQQNPEVQGEIERLRGVHVEWLEEPEAGRLTARLADGGVDEVIVSAEVPRALLSPLLRACDQVGMPARVRMDRADLDLPRPRAEVLGPSLYLLYQKREPDHPSLLVKSILDRGVGLAASVALAPLMLGIAALVRFTSPGPALFVQPRGGLNGRPFRMLKFRTMRRDAEAEREQLLAVNEMDGPVFKIANDPRITPIGRFLRRFSLDELPQLLNVVAGDMSLVGPRPLPIVETRELTGIDRKRLSMKPGITCLWQVSGRNDLTFREWMALDLYYVDNWSLGLDLAILARTVPAMVSGRGAR